MSRTRQWYYNGAPLGGETGKTVVVGAGQENPDLWECRTQVDYGADSIAALFGLTNDAPTLDSVTFTDNNDGTPATLDITYTGNVTGYRVYIATGDATISVSAAQLYAAAGGTGTIEFADFPVGLSVDITGLTAASDGAVRISAALVKSVDGANPSNVVTETVSGLDFTVPAPPTAATDVAGDTITLTFAEAIYGAQDVADFVLSGAGANSRTIASVSGFGTTALTLELSGAVVAGALTLAYTDTDSDLRDADGNNLVDFSGLTVTNNLSAGAAVSLTFVGMLGGGFGTGTTSTYAAAGLGDEADGDLVLMIGTQAGPTDFTSIEADGNPLTELYEFYDGTTHSYYCFKGACAAATGDIVITHPDEGTTYSGIGIYRMADAAFHASGSDINNGALDTDVNTVTDGALLFLGFQWATTPMTLVGTTYDGAVTDGSTYDYVVGSALTTPNETPRNVGTTGGNYAAGIADSFAPV